MTETIRDVVIRALLRQVPANLTSPNPTPLFHHVQRYAKTSVSATPQVSANFKTHKVQGENFNKTQEPTRDAAEPSARNIAEEYRKAAPVDASRAAFDVTLGSLGRQCEAMPSDGQVASEKSLLRSQCEPLRTLGGADGQAYVNSESTRVGMQRLSRNDVFTTLHEAVPESFRRELPRQQFTGRLEHLLVEQRQLERIIEALGAQQAANRGYHRAITGKLQEIAEEAHEAQNELDRIRDSFRNR